MTPQVQPQVKLSSSEGQSFDIAVEVANKSEMLKSFMEGEPVHKVPVAGSQLESKRRGSSLCDILLQIPRREKAYLFPPSKVQP